MDKIEIQRINPKTYTNQDWKIYFEVRKLHAMKREVPLRFASWEELKERSEDWINSGIGIYLVYKNGTSIGFFSFDIRLKQDANRRYVYFRNGLIEDLSQSILKELYPYFLDFDAAAKYLVIRSVNGKNDFLQEQINATLADYRALFSLTVDQANVEVMNSWVAESVEKFEHYELRHYEAIPDTLLKEYCAVFSELLHDMPNDSKIYDFSHVDPDKIRAREAGDQKNGQCSYRYIVFDQGRMIGKTNVYFNKNKPEIMNQYMTGTLKAYRRQGIGKWMKAAMYLKLVKDFPSLKMIKTEIHPKNMGSKELNRQMGFVQTGFEKEWLITRERIVQELKG